MPKLEIACFNEDSALIAAREGVDRIELCKNYPSGGLTPNPETLQNIKTQCDIPTYTMIRPRKGSFLYTEKEFAQMKTQLQTLKEAGADGFVFGILTANGKVDTKRNSTLVNLAEGLPCTFHRAFDEIENKKQALKEVTACGFKTILTSGGASSAIKGVSVLKKLKKQGGDKITILAGGGIRSYNIAQIKPHFDFVHSACLQPGREIVDRNELIALKKNLQ